MEKDKKEIIEKIRKIMALAENNPNENEAMAAALKAQKLMAEYHVDEKELGQKVTEDNIDTLFCPVDGKSQKWKLRLAIVLAKNFRCNLYVIGSDVCFYGYEEDRQICAEVYKTLYKIGSKLSDKKKREQRQIYGTAKGVRNTFCLGFVDGIKKALEKQCTALMIVVPKEVNDKFKTDIQLTGTVKSTSVKFDAFRKDIYDEGFIKGKEAIEQRAIEGVV